MAILGGLFSAKKEKRKPDNPASLPSTAASDFDSESLAGTEYDPRSPAQSRPNTVYLNAAASSSKLKLPFRRKKSATAQPPASVSAYFTPPRPTRYSTTRSEAAIDSMHPPPSRSALFSEYGDDGSRSTPSLPTADRARSDSHDSARTAVAPPMPATKSGGIFSWARERKKSKAPPPPSREDIDSSFNLKAFRHVRADPTMDLSESPSPPPIPPAIPAARPRPRGDSIASDSSQRISVAAFREMQARRSTANSPTPSASPRPTPIPDNYTRLGSPNSKPLQQMLSSGPSQSPLQQRKVPRTPMPAPRKSILRSSTSSDTSSEESDSDTEPSDFSPRSILKVKSEVGHGSPSMQFSRNPPQLPVQKSAGSIRPRASGSESAVLPNVAAKQATAAFRAIPPQPKRRTTRDSDTSSSGSGSSDDDAPLASLVQPRRPESAMSAGSNKTLSAKPLIDIGSLLKPSSMTSAAPGPSAISTHSSQSPPLPRNDTLSPTNVTDRLANLAQGINSRGPGGVSRSGDGGTSGKSIGGSSHSRSMTVPDSRIASTSSVPTSSTTRSVAPPEHRATISVDTFSTGRGTDSFVSSPSNGTVSTATRPTSATSSSSFEKVEYSPPVRPKRVSLCLDDTSTPIIPTPIHHRTPHSGFRVTSRPDPLSRQSHPQEKSDALSNSKRSSSFDFTQSLMSSLDLDKLPLDLEKSSSPEATKSTNSLPSSTSPTIRVVGSSSSTQPKQLVPSKLGSPASSTLAPTAAPARKRSSTLLSMIPAQPLSTKKPSLTKSNTATGVNTIAFTSSSKLATSSRPKSTALISKIPDSPTKSSMPPKPFASSSGTRRNSPASSTGDSSSGRGAPITPRDGSEIESDVGGRGRSRGLTGATGTTSALIGRKAGHRRSLSHDGMVRDAVNPLVDEETRRRERRRSEARNAIELGNVMNKPIRLNDDDRDDLHSGMAIDPRTSMFNPMMGMGMGVAPPNIGFNMPGNSHMSWLPPIPPSNQGPMQQFMIPQPPSNVDPRFFAAHQQAMMVAKQAYQYAVAQQAMAAAADEWERGSSVGVMTGGRGGWGPIAGSMMFPSGPRSMYAGSAYGGSDEGRPSGGGWGSRSVYGEAFGPAPGAGNRSSMMFHGEHSNMPPSSESPSQLGRSAPHQRPGARQRTKTAPPESSGSGAPFSVVAQEQVRARGRTPPPPSSWKRRQREH